jgi:hypothetical protein
VLHCNYTTSEIWMQPGRLAEIGLLMATIRCTHCWRDSCYVSPRQRCAVVSQSLKLDPRNGIETRNEALALART